MNKIILLPLFLLILTSLKAYGEESTQEMPYRAREDQVVLVPLTDDGSEEDVQEAWVKVLRNRIQQLTSNVSSYSRIVRALTLASQSDAFKDGVKRVLRSLGDSINVLFLQINEVLGEEDRERLSHIFDLLERIFIKLKRDPTVLQKEFQDPQLKQDMQYLKVIFLTAILPVLKQEETRRRQQRVQNPQAQRDLIQFLLKIVEDGNEIFSSED